MDLTGLYQLLSGEATITALVGDRIEPIELSPGQTMPALTFKFVGGSSEPTFDTSGMQKRRVELNAYGSSALSADQVRTAVVKFLNGPWRVELADGSYLDSFELIAPLDFPEPDARRFRCMVELYAFFNFPSS